MDSPTPLGVVSMTGIAGLTLGGGVGWLNGKHGLACDNVLAAEVVTADGQVSRASPTENQDLYSAIRGRSGNFGVVTSFVYQLHPVGRVLAGPLVYPLAQAHTVLRFYREFAAASPDELSTLAGLGVAPDGSSVVGLRVCYYPPIEEGEALLQPLRTFVRPMLDAIQPMAFCDVQQLSDAGYPSGRLHYWKASYLKDLSDDAIDVLTRFMAQTSSPVGGVGLQHMHGAAARVDPAATAFPHRDEHFDLEILSQWDDPAQSDRIIDWTREFFAAMEPFLERGVYVNGPGNEGEDRVRAAYGANFDRPAALKARYDPTNLFRNNHNIRPVAQVT